MTANEYGAYTFANEENFCREMRWVISGTRSALWPNEPKPVLVHRGTAIEVLDRKDVKCAAIDSRLSFVHGDLIRYREPNGAERWVAASDVYTPQQYDAYASSDVRAHQYAHKNRAFSPTLRAPEVPRAILSYGYEEGISRMVNGGVSLPKEPSCEVSTADSYVSAAHAAFDRREYAKARLLAYGSVFYTDACHDSDHPAQARADGLLLFSKSELRLGMLTAGKNDADAAAGTYVECSSESTGYSSNAVDHCQSRRQEAHAIVQDG